MNEEAAFLKAIKKNPDDRTARLVFADWLQERDDPRAPWVRDDEIWQWMKPDAKDPTAKLIAAIRRGHKKWNAERALGRLGPAAVPALLSALRDADERGSHLLQSALGAIGSSAEPVLPILLAALKESNPRVHAGAFQCLTRLILGSPEALEAVIAGFDSPDQNIRNEAFRACCDNSHHDTGREKLRPAVSKLHEIVRRDEADQKQHARSSALNVLYHMRALDASLIPLLVSLLVDSMNCDAAAGALDTLGEAAAKAILEAAEELTGRASWLAAGVLERIGPVAISLLQKELKNSCPNARHIAATALTKLTAEPDADMMAGLIEALRSDDAVQHKAVEVVRDLGPAAAATLPALLEIIERATGAVWHVTPAILALGPAAQSAVPTLLTFVARLRDLACGEAGGILDRLGHGPSGLLVALGRNDDEAINYIPLSGEDFAGVRNDLRHAFHDTAERTALRKLARLALALTSSEAVGALCPFLSDGSQPTRLVAVFALWHVGTTEAAAALLVALKDKDRCVRLCAVRALVRIGKNANGTTDALRAATNDRAKDVREAAAKALAELASGKAD